MIRIFGKGKRGKGLKDVILVLTGVGKEDRYYVMEIASEIVSC